MAADNGSMFARIGGALEAGINKMESATGVDLDRDGDVTPSPILHA